jgi:hypothetical protein
MERRFWYVFDQFDCVDKFKTAIAAGDKASDMVLDGCIGIHIAYMSEVEFDAYAETNKFPFAK